MPFIQIFVEDALSEAYEILAARALGIDHTRRSEWRRQVHAAQLGVNEFTTLASLLDLIGRAYQTGSRCILFILDEEDYHESPDRPAKLADFQRAFTELCAYLDSLPADHHLRMVKVIRIVSKTCLECWLLADPQAIVTALRGPSSYRPQASNTTNSNPRRARDQIAHIINQVHQHNNSPKRVGGHSIKSLGKKIAPHVNPEQARQRNFSLRYFYDMITCERSGCEHPFPEPG